MHPTLKWILACNDRDGFGLFPGDGPNLLGTYCALSALKLFSEPIPDAGNIARFILGKQNPDHGFCNRFGRWPAESTWTSVALGI